MRRVALGLLVMALSVAGYVIRTHQQEQKRLRAARERVGQVFGNLVPQVEARLAQVTSQLGELRTNLNQTAFAGRAAEIELARYRVKEKRLRLLTEEMAGAVERLGYFAEQAPRRFALPAGKTALAEDQTEELARLRTQLEQLQEQLDLLGPEYDLARERRTYLAAAESEATLRAEAEAAAQQREQEEALQRAQAESVALAQAEAAARAQAGANRLARTGALQAAWREAPAGRSVYRRPVQVCFVPMLPLRLNAPLVIGSSYPDRFIGYRSFCRPPPLPICFWNPPPPFWGW